MNFTLLSPSNQSVKCLYISGGTISNTALSSVKVQNKQLQHTFSSTLRVHPQTNDIVVQAQHIL